MPVRSAQPHCLLALFDRFIRDSRNGRRLQPNGRRYAPGTINNYTATCQLLHQFTEAKNFPLRFLPAGKLNQRELVREHRYWKRFYRVFTNYLYDERGHYDNYVGATIKNLKAFFAWLERDRLLAVGGFQKCFYVRKEEIAIHPLLPEELNYLIYNKPFIEGLTPRLREARDVFVVGCTVALRVSDLLALKRTALRRVGGELYLGVRSQKTETDTLVKLPPYVIDIVQRYIQKRGTRLLPPFNKTNLNLYIKQLLEHAGFTHPVQRLRSRRGRQVATCKGTVRLCDVASTHTMRRTAITTMLCLGMPEAVVRKISGHAPGTKEFYRYVLWAQAYYTWLQASLLAITIEESENVQIECK